MLRVEFTSLDNYNAFKRSINNVNKAFDEYDSKTIIETEYQKQLSLIVEEIRYRYVEQGSKALKFPIRVLEDDSVGNYVYKL
jgi:hypothetical protein